MGRLQKVFFYIFLQLTLVFTLQSAWAAENFIPLQTGENAPALNNFIQYTKDYKGPLTHQALTNPDIIFEGIDTPSIQFGFVEEELLIIFTVRNIGDETGDWILGTGRKSVKNFKLFEIGEFESRPIIDSNDIKAFNRNIRTYFRLSHQFELQPNQSRTLAISYNPEKYNFYMPLKIETVEHFSRRQMTTNIIVFGSFIGILVLIMVNAGLFVITGEKSFIWLGLAELFYGLQSLQISGHFTYIFFLIDENYIHNRNLNELIGMCTGTMFIVFIILFAKSFIKTKINYPKFDTILSVIAISSILVHSLQWLDLLRGNDINLHLFIATWVLVLLTSMTLPVVAIRATIDISRNFWPLIVAWVIFVFFMLYGICLILNLFPSLPISRHFIGPVGLFETLFATLALALQVRQVVRDKTAGQLQLADALAVNLQESEKARYLAEQKAEALSVITNQSNLIHASGHDSKQVITALNSAISMLGQDKNLKNKEQLKDIIESSTNYLKQIISSTLSGANMAIVHSEFTALSKFSSKDLFLPLEMLYRKQARNNGIQLHFTYSQDDYLVSDLPILSRCLSNFISNSLKFTEKGQINIKGKHEGNTYKITVADTGTGLAQDILNRLNSNNEKRLKQSEEIEGSGSGFFHSSSLIHDLGGRVEIKNRQKTGAIVTIYLPLHKTLSLCKLETLMAALPDYEVVDIDAQLDISESTFPRTRRIAVTYDNSPIMREKMSESYRFAFYKPLSIEFAHHVELAERLEQIEFGSSE